MALTIEKQQYERNNIGGTGCVDGFTTTAMTNLRTAQLAGSNRLVRPDTTVTVKVQLNLLTINELDVKAQQLTTVGWLTMEGDDPRFSWTPALKDTLSTSMLCSRKCGNRSDRR
ncbi:hypothetical protein ScPMuIL_016961 [Solemya velum]